MTDYLHGVETTESSEINLTITDADISSVVVIGTAPSYLLSDVETLNKITNFTEAKKYTGNNIDGFTLPDAVQTILTESGGANIYTINVFDNNSHISSVSKTVEFTNGEYSLNELGIQNLVITKDETELTEGTDYEFSDNTITVLSGGALETDQSGVTVSYVYADLTLVSDSDIIGTTDDEGNRTGLQKIYDIIAEYGVTPGIIVVPGFSSKNVRTAVETIAEKIRAFAYLDVEKGTTIAAAEKARLAAVDDLDLTTTSEYSMLVMPYVYRYNSYQDTTTLKPLSPVYAGLRVKLDRNRNVAKSIDNTVSTTITGSEYPIWFMLNDSSTDSNRINALGISTVINYKGSYYLWGGRNNSYTSDDGIMSFESARRTRNFVQKSVEDSSFACVGENITRGFIDDVLNAINAAFAKWSNPSDTSNYILYDGEAYWDESLNSAEDLAAGHIRFPYKWCPLSTAERITYEDVLDITIITDALS